MGDQRVVVLAFTRRSTDVETLIDNLLNDPYFQQSADSIRNITGMPVFFFYRKVENSTIHVVTTAQVKIIIRFPPRS